MTHIGGAWKGLFGHKNGLGRVIAFGLLLVGFGKPQGMPRWGRAMFLLSAIPLLLFSQSVTALVSATLIIALYPVIHVLRVKTRGTVPLWAALAPLVAMSMLLLLANVSLFLAVLGRDDTLTGRTPLWSAVVHSIQERPLLGYGYAAFWMPKSPDSSDVVSAVGWLSGHSHNGYLDLCLDVGLVGAFLFAAGFGVTFSRAISLFQKRSSSSEKWPLIFLIFYIVYNFAESNLPRTHTFLLLPYVSIYVSLALVQSRARQRASQPVLVPEYST